MSTFDLCRPLRLLLGGSEDAPPLQDLLQRVDIFVLECSASPNSADTLNNLEEDLQKTFDGVIDHSNFNQLEIFLAVLFHLRPILPASSLISTWFDLVLRPALREPKLPTSVVKHTKELILSALEHHPDVGGSEKQNEKVRNFRRRLMDFYLLDAYNESSQDDVLEWANLDSVDRERKACWKNNLEDVLIQIGLHRPEDLLTEAYLCFSSPTSRVQLLMLFNAYTSQPNFPERAAEAMACHPIMQSLLHSLILDNSSTACSIGLNVLTKLLPMMAVHACEELKGYLPQLFLILARVLCWKSRPPSPTSFIPADLPPDLVKDLTADDVDSEPEEVPDNSGMRIRSDLDWQRLELLFSTTIPFEPPAEHLFSFVYYLFPCNTLRFLRFPVPYLTESNLETPYALPWDKALDEGLIRSKSESLLRGHVLHPLLIWRDAAAELAKPDFWAEYSVDRIVGECTMLDVRNAPVTLVEQPSKTPTPPFPKSGAPDSPLIPSLSSSVESTVSSVVSVVPRIPSPAPSTKFQISLQNMVSTSVALKSGAEIEIVDPVSSWSPGVFQQPRDRSPSRETETSGSATIQPSLNGQDNDDVPSHVAQAVSSLQREVLLLRSELNFELWMARENVKHIGRLYQDRVVSKNAEMERQGLHNKMRELKHDVQRLKQLLERHQNQSSNLKNQYMDWNRKLQDKVSELRVEKSNWNAEATRLKAADVEKKESFAAQGKLLAEATNKVFQLETKIKENAHKIDRLHDYERQIDQLIKMQRLWESDVHQFNDQNEYLKVFSSEYRKMELRLDDFVKIQAKMDEESRSQRLQIQALEAQLKASQNQLASARKQANFLDLPQYHHEAKNLALTNQRFRDENAELHEEVEELKMMVELLKYQVSGRRGLISSPRMSPLLPSASL